MQPDDASALEDSIRQRLEQLNHQLTEACREAGRDPAEVTLVGVSKGQPVERLQAAWKEGLRVFGENRVQEALTKGPELPPEASWHLIGPLQSNKVKKALDLFTTIHSVDRPKIARALSREAHERNLTLRCFLEVNLGDETNKHGFPASGLADAVAPLADLPNLEIAGLMAIPPHDETPRHWFRKLRQLRDDLSRRPEWSGWPGWLSMGMSGDFAEAIAEGATHVRVGTALFGPRPGV
jgi:pyridoxal phosphate enzyme (YggS family)